MDHHPIPTSIATGAHLSITVDELMHLRLVALGSIPPSLIIRGGTILCLHTSELLERDVIIYGRYIAAITPWGHFPAGPEEIDARGKFVSPGFIDTHIHVEYTKLVPGELARLSIPRGTTTILADANCIANVFGGLGMDFMGTTTTPLRIFRQVSHKIPGNGPDIELGGTSVSTEELCFRVSQPEAATLGESNPFSLDRASAEKQAAALHAGKRITGHTALLENEPLWAYSAGGIGDDHNAHQTKDVIERLRLGMMLTVMSGSMNSNIQWVFEDIPALKGGLGHISFCADDKLAEDLDREGHIDHHVRTAIQLGVDILAAYRMATLNAALYYRLDHLIGSVTPAKLADLLILDSLEEARPTIVIMNGKVVAQNYKPTFDNTDLIPHFTLNSIHIDPSYLNPSTFRVAPKEPDHAWVQAMEMYDGYFKRAFHARLPVSDKNSVESDVSRDILKVVVIDRHHATKNHGISFVRGFGLRKGAIACTTNCENQNLVVIGTSDQEIADAVSAIITIGGGFVAVADGQILGSVRLDVAGCMSSEPWEMVRDDSIACVEAVHSILGSRMKSPFMIMSFVGLVAVPDLGLTEKGLVDCRTQGLMDVVLEGKPEDGVERGATERPVKICCRCPSHAHDIHRMMDVANSIV
ncbi:adenine deaminase [Mollisia scopiformis]|uniref:adenine deaminase n=1 Tax=Mollisia scopiformis TaxID=149040 RepID=A0A194XSB7_MOLSC|nr:adenine deaminase [Mollisia scopiformis]KUJ23036.1 adenine deaminase [Mollisia scopiformis]